MYTKILNKKRLFVAFVLLFIAIWWSLRFKSIQIPGLQQLLQN